CRHCEWQQSPALHSAKNARPWRGEARMIAAATESLEAREHAINALWQLSNSSDPRFPHLYVVLDAARDERIYEGLCRFEHDLTVASLYNGAAAEELATVCAYLVTVPPQLNFFDWLWRDGWGHNWGIFLWCTGTFESVRTHLRQLTRVKADGKTLLFRFYDPRTLTAVLPILDNDQLRQMFGPILYFFAETEFGAALLEFRLFESALRSRKFVLFPG